MIISPISIKVILYRESRTKTLNWDRSDLLRTLETLLISTLWMILLLELSNMIMSWNGKHLRPFLVKWFHTLLSETTDRYFRLRPLWIRLCWVHDVSILNSTGGVLIQEGIAEIKKNWLLIQKPLFNGW